MRLLLDTHAFVWLVEDDRRMPDRVREQVRLADAVYVSFATAWEYSMKRKKWPDSFKRDFAAQLAGFPAECLGIDFEVYRYAESLPLIHPDPVDRMLIAHALHEGLTLVTKDREIRRYPVPTIW